MAGNSNPSIEERLMQLQKAKEKAESKAPKIQQVAHHLRDRKHFAKHYKPKLVSLGPIHHGDPKLKAGEQYKQMWAARYIGSTGQTLHDKVSGDIEELKDLFDADLFTNNDVFSKYYDREGFRNMEEKICWTLFVDGCALLHILKNAKLDNPHEMNVKVDQLVLVMQDVLLLENQLPYPLLKLLWRDTDESDLIKFMKDFLWCHHWATRDEDKVNVKTQFPPTHLLDLQRYIILYDPSPNNRNQTKNYPNDETSDMVTYRNIKELKARGIGLKTSKTRRPKDISFSYGWFRSELTLPEIVVDDTTAATVLNLIAYEMCPDFKNDYGICSYVSFLDSLIDHTDDVKALRSEKILLNSLGSDEEVANLFNTLGTDLVPDMEKYARIRAQIGRHYNNKCKTWLALGYHTYFSNPWAIIAFHAAVFGLALTFIQTWYAIHPSKS